jgi:hypothetical protein
MDDHLLLGGIAHNKIVNTFFIPRKVFEKLKILHIVLILVHIIVLCLDNKICYFQKFTDITILFYHSLNL